MISASAPAKVILFGEHAVVHGQPAIAVPLTAVQARAEIESLAPGSGLIIEALDIGQLIHLHPGYQPEESPVYDALIFPVEIALQALDLPLPDLHIRLRSTIPIASGLGSGAALAAALIRAVGEALGRPFSNDQLNPLVYEVEKRHHGTPSGIDNTVIVYQQPVYFVRGAAIETFAIAQPFTLLVADTGIASSTKSAVADVRTLYEAEPERIGPIFDRIGAIARAARQAIESGDIDKLGPLMDENQTLLHDLTVSSPELEHLIETARAAGALGAKLSGGGRGGNMIALVEPDRAGSIRETLLKAGAVNVIQTVVGC
jgi:mevalonate kinase